MPIVALSITKSTPFQGATEEFSNVYTLDSGTFDVSSDWSGVAGHYADAERAVHSLDVAFLRWAVWSIGGTPTQNVFLDAGDLAGAGNLPGGSLYRECAVLVRFELSRSAVLRRRRFLSKWLHSCNLPGAGTLNGGVFAGSEALPSSVRQVYLDYADDIRAGPVGSGVFLSDPQGERPGAASVQTYLEHRQFHR